jgi:hypothetical protein
VAELRAAMLVGFSRTVQLGAAGGAERGGRRADDLAERALAGAGLGVGLAAMLTWAEDPAADYLVLLDAAMAQLEAGLPL